MTGPVPPGEKVLTRKELLDGWGRPREGCLVFTNGCFDLLHRGHVTYLNQARRLGDALIVALNTDDSVRRLKGPGRPVVAEDDRAFVMAGLECVDAVTLFDEDTPRELIAGLLPDILVKGGDYDIERIVGREEVEEAGGRVVTIPFIQGYSSTELILRTNKIRRTKP